LLFFLLFPFCGRKKKENLRNLWKYLRHDT
jgi:hypothetical protein